MNTLPNAMIEVKTLKSEDKNESDVGNSSEDKPLHVTRRKKISVIFTLINNI